MRSSRRRRDEEGRCKEAEKGGPGIKRHKGRRRKRKRRPCNKKIKKKKRRERWKSGSVQGVRAMTGARFVNTHIRDPPRYLSVWNFLRWESLFLIENNKNPKNRTSFFVFSSSSFLFFLSPSFFSILIFLRFLFFFFFFKEIDGNNSEEKFYLFSASFDLLLRLV